MGTYVLVPGANLGAWAWRDVTAGLRERGHEVYPLTLTGLADRAHLGGPEVDLETHVADVVGLIEAEELADVTLVGHSYAGIPVGVAADRIGSRLSRVVYVDSAPVAEGMRMFDLTGPEGAEALRAQAAAGDGWGIPYGDPGDGGTTTGLTPGHLAEMRRRATPHPLGTYEQTAHYRHTDPGSPELVEIACEDFRALLDAGHPGVAFIDDTWSRIDLQTGHWPMFSAPGELTEALAGLADGR